MQDYRKSKDCIAHYNSFEELRIAIGKNPFKRKPNNPKELKAQQEKLLGTCPYCKELLSYIGGNIVSCKNEVCKGRKIEKENEDGTKTITYKPYFKLLNKKQEQKAHNLFE